LRANVEFILENFFGEPYSPVTDVPGATSPALAALLPNYPNPFNPQTMIPFALPVPGYAELSIYDAAGRLVRTLVAEVRPSGKNLVRWDGTDAAGRAVASGTYFARLTAADQTVVRSLVLVR
jgi:predicted TIM-barrel enzyme